MYPFYVIEDELGTLALAVYNKNHTELIYLYRFYHMNPGMLQTDLAKLAEGENPETQWDNNELSRSDRDQKERLETWFWKRTRKVIITRGVPSGRSSPATRAFTQNRDA